MGWSRSKKTGRAATGFNMAGKGMQFLPLKALALAFLAQFMLWASIVDADQDTAQMLLFGDHVAMAQAGANFPTTALTIEAWMLSDDTCHSATPFSYSVEDSPGGNGFVLYNSGEDLIVCIDELYIIPTCQDWQRDVGEKVALADGLWHHLAVTWSTANEGTVKIYVDGLLRKSFKTGHTKPLPQGGIMVLGNEQDCMGGCFESSQGYFGALDEIRLWRVERTQGELMDMMHASGDQVLHAKGADENLVGYWMLSEKGGDVALDSSAKGGHHFNLTFPPTFTPPKDTTGMVQRIARAGKVLSFSNNFARNVAVHDFPTASFTVEFWAQDKKNLTKGYVDSGRSTFFSYAAEVKDMIDEWEEELPDQPRDTEARFLAQAISIYNENTDGAITVVINGANREAEAAVISGGQWHHLAFSWQQSDGTAKVYVDGQEKWSGNMQAGSSRSAKGCLVLGQNQHCCGGCFEDEEALHGSLAELRVWKRVLTQEEVRALYAGLDEPQAKEGLAAFYDFGKQQRGWRHSTVRDQSEGHNDLTLGSSAPLWQTSTSPIDGEDRQTRVDKMGHALQFGSGVTLVRTGVTSFPQTELTIEFWMRTINTCSGATLLYYKFGPELKDAFSIIRQESEGLWVSLHGDEHATGLRASDGTWHHLAFTWKSSSGVALLYSNGVEVYRGTLAKGESIPPGGSLALGTALGCLEGCLDATLQFFGQLDEVRVWRTALMGCEIRERWMQFNIKVRDELVAYWKFDEGTGYRAQDSSGKDNHLTLTSSGSWVVSTAGEYAKSGGVPPPGGRKPRSSSLGGVLGGAFGVVLMGLVGGLAYRRREELLPMVVEARSWLAGHFEDLWQKLRGSGYRRGSILESLDGDLDDYAEAPNEFRYSAPSFR